MANIHYLILENLNNYYYDDEEEHPRKSSFFSKLLLTAAGLGGAGYLASQTNTGKSLINFGKAAYNKYQFDNAETIPGKIKHAKNMAINAWNGYKYGNQSPIMKNYVFPYAKQKIKDTIKQKRFGKN